MIFFHLLIFALASKTLLFTQSFSFKNHRVMLKAFSLVNPNCFFFCLLFFFHEKEKWVVGTNGLEPSTSRLSGVRSNHLSYAPFWWRWGGSNSWPPACKAGALPAELNPHIRFWVTPFQGPQNRTISNQLVSITCSRNKSSSMFCSCLTP